MLFIISIGRMWLYCCSIMLVTRRLSIANIGIFWGNIALEYSYCFI